MTPDDQIRALRARVRVRDHAAAARIFGTSHQAADEEQGGGTLPDPAAMLADALRTDQEGNPDAREDGTTCGC